MRHKREGRASGQVPLSSSRGAPSVRFSPGLDASPTFSSSSIFRDPNAHTPHCILYLGHFPSPGPPPPQPAMLRLARLLVSLGSVGVLTASTVWFLVLLGFSPGGGGDELIDTLSSSTRTKSGGSLGASPSYREQLQASEKADPPFEAVYVINLKHRTGPFPVSLVPSSCPPFTCPYDPLGRIRKLTSLTISDNGLLFSPSLFNRFENSSFHRPPSAYDQAGLCSGPPERDVLRCRPKDGAGRVLDPRTAAGGSVGEGGLGGGGSRGEQEACRLEGISEVGQRGKVEMVSSCFGYMRFHPSFGPGSHPVRVERRSSLTNGP